MVKGKRYLAILLAISMIMAMLPQSLTAGENQSWENAEADFTSSFYDTETIDPVSGDSEVFGGSEYDNLFTSSSGADAPSPAEEADAGIPQVQEPVSEDEFNDSRDNELPENTESEDAVLSQAGMADETGNATPEPDEEDFQDGERDSASAGSAEEDKTDSDSADSDAVSEADADTAVEPDQELKNQRIDFQNEDIAVTAELDGVENFPAGMALDIIEVTGDTQGKRISYEDCRSALGDFEGSEPLIYEISLSVQENLTDEEDKGQNSDEDIFISGTPGDSVTPYGGNVRYTFRFLNRQLSQELGAADENQLQTFIISGSPDTAADARMVTSQVIISESEETVSFVGNGSQWVSDPGCSRTISRQRYG